MTKFIIIYSSVCDVQKHVMSVDRAGEGKSGNWGVIFLNSLVWAKTCGLEGGILNRLLLVGSITFGGGDWH